MLAMKRAPLSIMIARMADKGHKGGSDEPDGDEGGEGDYEEPDADEGELAACQDVLDAIQKRSAKDLSVALHRWMELAGYGDRQEE